MAIQRARAALGRIFFQRCFYLFLALLLLVTAAPLIDPTSTGRVAVNLLNMLIIVSAVATLGQGLASFVIALLLAAPTMVFLWLGLSGYGQEMFMRSWVFGAALYAATLSYLLGYVFRRDVMTADKLWGAAASYLMIGVLWVYLYALVQYFYPGSFGIGGVPDQYDVGKMVYFSFTVLTSTGFGDFTPLSRQARSLCVLEQIVGVLFVTILIARLAGVYPPKGETEE
jgi:hypothetical protein